MKKKLLRRIEYLYSMVLTTAYLTHVFHLTEFGICVGKSQISIEIRYNINE